MAAREEGDNILLRANPPKRSSARSHHVMLFAKAARGHWGIENTCHWTLGMTFREDEIDGAINGELFLAPEPHWSTCHRTVST